MESIQEIVDELNALLIVRQIKLKLTIKPLLFLLKEKFNCKFVFLNTEDYNAEYPEIFHQLKVTFVRHGKIDLARKFRELEKECCYYSEIWRKINGSTSMFHYEANTLLYFCMGDTYIDCAVEDYFKELG